MSRVADILKMPAHKRRRLRLGKRRGHYAIEEKRSFSKEELLAFLKSRMYRTRSALRDGRVAGEPRCYDYEKAFGTWTEAVKEAFDIKEKDKSKEAEYMIESVIKFKLWTYRKYIAARMYAPDVVRSYYAVRKEWGDYANLKWAARTLSMEKLLDDYLKLARRMGRIPSIPECKARGLDMTKAVNHFGSKKKMDECLEGKVDEKRKRGKRKTRRPVR